MKAGKIKDIFLVKKLWLKRIFLQKPKYHNCTVLYHPPSRVFFCFTLTHTVDTHRLPFLTSYVCMPAHTSHSQRLCVAYVPHSIGGAGSLPSVNKLTVSAPVLHSTPLGKSHSLTEPRPTALCCKACCAYGSPHRPLHICHLLAATV